MTVSASTKERRTLRELAAKVAEIAALPVQQERAELLKSLNALHPQRPVVLAFPEGGWRDLVAEDRLICQGPTLRGWEAVLRAAIFRHEKIGDDLPILPLFNIGWSISISNYGLEETRTQSQELGAYHWDPPIKTRADFEKLRFRDIVVDRPETERQVNLATDIFGDLLQVRIRGALWWTVGLTQPLVFLRGLDQIMYDMCDNPQLLHDMMAFLRDEQLHALEVFESEGVLSLNNGPTDYVGSGGVGYTAELPAAGFNGRVRTRDMWCLSESQETVGVSPQMFEEFVLPYQTPVVNRFGLACYGCCEPLDRRIDLLLRAIPKLRRVSVSPWSNRELLAGKLSNRYVFSWKPNPALVSAPVVDWAEVERVTRETVRMTKGCCLEMILKDTHTFCGDIERVGHWVQIARRAVEEQ
jgi:hypothetical protein